MKTPARPSVRADIYLRVRVMLALLKEQGVTQGPVWERWQRMERRYRQCQDML